MKGLFRLGQNLTALICACFQVDMMAALRLARIAVFNPIGGFQRVVGPAHITLGFCRFSLRNSHGTRPLLLSNQYYSAGYTGFARQNAREILLK